MWPLYQYADHVLAPCGSRYPTSRGRDGSLKSTIVVPAAYAEETSTSPCFVGSVLKLCIVQFGCCSCSGVSFSWMRGTFHELRGGTTSSSRLSMLRVS